MSADEETRVQWGYRVHPPAGEAWEVPCVDEDAARRNVEPPHGEGYRFTMLRRTVTTTAWREVPSVDA